MEIVATTSLPAVNRPKAARWNATRSCQKTHDYSGHYVIASSQLPEHRPLERRMLVPIESNPKWNLVKTCVIYLRSCLKDISSVLYVSYLFLMASLSSKVRLLAERRIVLLIILLIAFIELCGTLLYNVVARSGRRVSNWAGGK